MQKSEDIKELAVSLSKAQFEVENVVKNTAGYNYKYATLEQVIEVAKPALHTHGLAIMHLPLTEGDLTGVEYFITHTSGQWMSGKLLMGMNPGKNTLAQAAGSVITYARRYTLLAILNMAATDDDGCQLEEPKAKPKPAPKPKPNPAPEPERREILYRVTDILRERLATKAEIKTMFDSLGIEGYGVTYKSIADMPDGALASLEKVLG